MEYRVRRSERSGGFFCLAIPTPKAGKVLSVLKDPNDSKDLNDFNDFNDFNDLKVLNDLKDFKVVKTSIKCHIPHQKQHRREIPRRLLLPLQSAMLLAER